jgi:pimeloyl-ACP methyl ester carboxylesterase
MVRSVRSDDGTTVAYESRGAGAPALVLVHGWSCDRGYWASQLERLSQEFLVVTLDLAGHGESDCRRQEWSIAAFGGDVAAVVDDLALEDVVLIGHSMGGDVILEAARRLPGRVRGLIWIDTYREFPQLSTDEQIHRSMAPFRADFVEATRGFVRTMFGAGADPLLTERIVQDMSAAPPDVALGALEAAWKFGRAVPALLSELRLPLIAINPDDASTKVDSMKRLGIEVVLLAGVGHFSMIEDPQAVNDQLMKAVRSIGTWANRTSSHVRPATGEVDDPQPAGEDRTNEDPQMRGARVRQRNSAPPLTPSSRPRIAEKTTSQTSETDDEPTTQLTLTCAVFAITRAIRMTSRTSAAAAYR